MKIVEIRELSTKELLERVESEMVDYNQQKINHRVSPIPNPTLLRQKRRTIARLRTELCQRKLNGKG
jgi:large subunit ribosomal protein L29